MIISIGGNNYSELKLKRTGGTEGRGTIIRSFLLYEKGEEEKKP